MKIKMHGFTGRTSFELYGYDCTVSIKNHGPTNHEDWSGCTHWKVKLSYQERSATFDYYTGGAIRIDEFDLSDFFCSLELDLMNVLDYGGDYPVFAEEYACSYDKAESILNACAEIYDKLNRVFSSRCNRVFELFTESV